MFQFFVLSIFGAPNMTLSLAFPCQIGDVGNGDYCRGHKQVSLQGVLAQHTKPMWVLAQITGNENPMMTKLLNGMV